MAGETRSRLIKFLSTVQCAQVRAGLSVSYQTVITPKMSRSTLGDAVPSYDCCTSTQGFFHNRTDNFQEKD